MSPNYKEFVKSLTYEARRGCVTIHTYADRKHHSPHIHAEYGDHHVTSIRSIIKRGGKIQWLKLPRLGY